MGKLRSTDGEEWRGSLCFCSCAPPPHPRSLSALVLQVRKDAGLHGRRLGAMVCDPADRCSLIFQHSLIIQHFIFFHWIPVYELGPLETIASILSLHFGYPKFGLCKTDPILQGRLRWRGCFIRSEGPGIYHSSFPR